MKVTITSISGDAAVFTLDVSEDLEIENFKVLYVQEVVIAHFM